MRETLTIQSVITVCATTALDNEVTRTSISPTRRIPTCAPCPRHEAGVLVGRRSCTTAGIVSPSRPPATTSSCAGAVDVHRPNRDGTHCPHHALPRGSASIERTQRLQKQGRLVALDTSATCSTRKAAATTTSGSILPPCRASRRGSWGRDGARGARIEGLPELEDFARRVARFRRARCGARVIQRNQRKSCAHQVGTCDATEGTSVPPCTALYTSSQGWLRSEGERADILPRSHGAPVPARLRPHLRGHVDVYPAGQHRIPDPGPRDDVGAANAFRQQLVQPMQSKMTGNIVFILLPPAVATEFFSPIARAMARGLTVGTGVLLATSVVDVPLAIPLGDRIRRRGRRRDGTLASTRHALDKIASLPPSRTSSSAAHVPSDVSIRSTASPFWQSPFHRIDFYMIDGFVTDSSARRRVPG